ncbi:MAG: hypothetical protein U0745_04320 [Polyangia bacterium]|jgi:hypothetical protein
MSLASSAQGAYRWTGSLKETSIRQLYERCQRIRLTGNMRLQQGEQALDLTWIGGEPIENEGDQGTRSLPLWTNGEFIVEQRIPDWKGRLTHGIELTGSLRAGQVTAIYKLCADNQLSSDVELLRSTGEVAQVRFTLGKAESAVIAGQSESAIAAMSKLNGWTDGTFRIVMRPAFGEEKAAEAPVFKGQSDGQFDVTGAADVSKNADWPTGANKAPSNPPRAAASSSATTPAQSASAPNPPKAANPAASSGSASAIPPRLAQTLIKAPAPAGLVLPSAAATVPMSTASKEQIAAAQGSGNKSKVIVIVSLIVIMLCLGGIAAAVLLR